MVLSTFFMCLLDIFTSDFGRHLFNCIFHLSLFIYFERERERERERAGEGQRERERVPGRVHTVCAEPDSGLELTNRGIMT